MWLVLNQQLSEIELNVRVIGKGNLYFPSPYRDFLSLLECLVWTLSQALSRPQPWNASGSLTPPVTPERKGGVIGCTSQMKRPEAERLSSLHKSDKDNSVPARSPYGAPESGGFLPVLEGSIMTPQVFQTAFLHPP